MNTLSIERIGGMSSMRKVLARQHVSEDGLLKRFDNSPFGQEPDLMLDDYSDEPDYIPSGYFLDHYHFSNKK